jgi:hypothetical protein
VLDSIDEERDPRLVCRQARVTRGGGAREWQETKRVRACRVMKGKMSQSERGHGAAREGCAWLPGRGAMRAREEEGL